MDKIVYYFPRWLFPNNLGDSVATTIVPKALKIQNPNCKLEVVTHGDLIEVFSNDPNVNSVRLPMMHEIQSHYFWLNAGLDKNVRLNDNGVATYPEQHPNIYKFWRDNSEVLFNHPDLNITNVNILLQLGLEDLSLDYTNDLAPVIHIKENIMKNTIPTIAIVPATKKAGRGSPHPECDGIGFRFNGPRGLDSWGSFVKKVKQLLPGVRIIEISPENFGLGDEHFKFTSFIELAKKIKSLHLGVMGDGGIHNMFMATNTPVVLFHASKICKPEFYQHKNSYIPKDLLLNCRFNCSYYYTKVWPEIEDKSKTCNLECEYLDPDKLAEYTVNTLNNLL